MTRARQTRPFDEFNINTVQYVGIRKGWAAFFTVRFLLAKKKKKICEAGTVCGCVLFATCQDLI